MTTDLKQNIGISLFLLVMAAMLAFGIVGAITNQDMYDDVEKVTLYNEECDYIPLGIKPHPSLCEVVE